MPAETGKAAVPADLPRDPNGLPRGFRHDLINALNAIQGFATLLEADLPEGDSRSFASRIRQAGAEAMRLADMIPSSPKETVRVLMVSSASDADMLVLALDGFGCDITLVDSVSRANQALARAPKAWDLVLVEPVLAVHVEEAATTAGLPLLTRDPAMPAASLAILLRESVQRG
ncbi:MULTISPECIES: hypothetical protein [Azospirillaceae]|uniref:hypothetical protein n=1 Tax=Azospirillaceae TaxID=2829815 RepID=UPI000B6ADD62|nr:MULTISPECIES: hypothetical protein [Azospirillaceae]MDG5495436.1 hypothetical protein [Niveispirillum sp. BGYR6]SNS30283.1 hypothetical protein SAMN05880556_103391 [Azospirillum sp. RU38E]SNS48725.1 hypothetical protein SAMN05880591_103391 [Azospirillum sp. RU37A]